MQQLISADPNEPANYFALSRIYEDAGRYEEAEAALNKARDAKPDDPSVYTTISGFYNRQGQFDKTIEALHKAAELKPNDPQGHQLVATYYFDKTNKDHRLTAAQKKDYAKKGIEASDRALALNAEYLDALTYKNLLLRMHRQHRDRPEQAGRISCAKPSGSATRRSSSIRRRPPEPIRVHRSRFTVSGSPFIRVR